MSGSDDQSGLLPAPVHFFFSPVEDCYWLDNDCPGGQNNYCSFKTFQYASVTLASNTTLTVQGSLDLLMTDYGITPVKAMMGMLQTDPKVTVTFETVLAVSLT